MCSRGLQQYGEELRRGGSRSYSDCLLLERAFYADTRGSGTLAFCGRSWSGAMA
jgi:hypothetical protein